jgi:hypothetical protein
MLVRRHQVDRFLITGRDDGLGLLVGLARHADRFGDLAAVPAPSASIGVKSLRQTFSSRSAFNSSK